MYSIKYFVLSLALFNLNCSDNSQAKTEETVDELQEELNRAYKIAQNWQQEAKDWQSKANKNEEKIVTLRKIIFLQQQKLRPTNSDDSNNTENIDKLIAVAKSGNGIIVPLEFCEKLIPELENLKQVQTKNRELEQRLERLSIRSKATLKEDDNQ